jgi:hypothetical protein
MHANQIVARILDGVQDWMHASRWRALCDVANAAASGAPVSLTGLALRTRRSTALRHRVKCVDRLLGNAHLGIERQAIYAALAQRWLSGLPQLLIVVDWSSLSADLRWHWLRASVVVEGRSLTLYEEVHPRAHLANLQVHRHFIDRLARILPPGAQPPILLTDAGFRNPWFRLLSQRGWHWIGRIRNRDFVRQGAHESWFPAKQWYRKATAQTQDLGIHETVRNHPLTCRLVLIKKPPTGRKCRYASGKERCNTSMRKIALRNREPWLLTCATSLNHLSAQGIVNLYAQRMRIEQQFRDTKNLALGMGLSLNRSAGAERLQALLLIAHIAQLALRLIGEAAKAQQLELRLRSTGRTSRAEISIMTLARRLVENSALLRQIADPWQHLLTLRQQVTNAIHCASQSA